MNFKLLTMAICLFIGSTTVAMTPEDTNLGFVFSSGEDITHRYISADGNKITIFPDTTALFEYASGPQITQTPNGTRIAQHHGQTITAFSNGIVVTELANGIKTLRDTDGSRLEVRLDGTRSYNSFSTGSLKRYMRRIVIATFTPEDRATYFLGPDKFAALQKRIAIENDETDSD